MPDASSVNSSDASPEANATRPFEGVVTAPSTPIGENAVSAVAAATRSQMRSVIKSSARQRLPGRVGGASQDERWFPVGADGGHDRDGDHLPIRRSLEVGLQSGSEDDGPVR